MRVAYSCREVDTDEGMGERTLSRAVAMAAVGHEVFLVSERVSAAARRLPGVRWVRPAPSRADHEYFTDQQCYADRVYDSLVRLRPLDAADFAGGGGEALTVLRAKRLLGEFAGTTVVVTAALGPPAQTLIDEITAFAERYCVEHADVLITELAVPAVAARVVGGADTAVLPGRLPAVADELIRLYRSGGRMPRPAPPDDLVSVVVPLYDQGRFLADAIASVRRAGYPNIEIIVVDDGSADPATVAAFDAFDGVVKIRQPNRGLSAARNAGIARATGRYIVPLDADDQLPPGFLVPAVRALGQYPELGYVTGNLRYFGLLERTHVPVGHVSDLSLVVNTYARATGVYRRDALLDIGGYDEELPAYEDWDLHWRFHVAEYSSDVLPIVGQLYRRHRASMTFGTDDATRTMLLQRLVRKHAAALPAERLMSLLLTVTHLWKSGYEPSASVRLLRGITA
jgi:hypothetical protein